MCCFSSTVLEKQHIFFMSPSAKLTRRERQVVQILASKEHGATVGEIQAAMESPPSYSAVRALLKVMEEKGFVTHRQDGPRYVYESTVPRKKMRKSALREVLSGFFNGSRAALVETLFDPSDGSISPTEIERLSELIKQAKKQKGD